MKFYIVSDTVTGTDDYDGIYYLISETGCLVDSWICSNKKFAMYDLYTNNIKNQNKCKELSAGSEVEVLYLGDDSMTNTKLHKLVKNYVITHYSQEL